MKNNLFTTLFLFSIQLSFAQTDTIQLFAFKNNAKKENLYAVWENNTKFWERYPSVQEAIKGDTFFRMDFPYAGIKGEHLTFAIDKASVANKKDSLNLVEFARTHFAQPQKEYFSRIGQNIPDINGTLLSGEATSLSSFFGKPLLIFVFDASDQRGFDALRYALPAFEKKFKEKGLKTLILSRNSASEMKHYVEQYKIETPILCSSVPTVNLIFTKITPSYFLLLDEKGKLKHSEFFAQGKTWYDTNETDCNMCYIYHNQQKNYNKKDYFFEKMSPAIERFFRSK